MADVGIGGVAGFWPNHLLENEHVSRTELWKGAKERGFRCSLREAAVQLAPGIKRNLVVVLVEHLVPHRLKDLRAGEQSSFLVFESRKIAGHSRCVGIKVGAIAVEKHLSGDSEVHPGARIAAIMNVVVHQQRMTTERNAAARGIQIGFGGDGILAVAEAVSDIGNEFGESNAQVGFAGCSPARQQLAETVEHDAAEATVIFSQIVD